MNRKEALRRSKISKAMRAHWKKESPVFELKKAYEEVPVQLAEAAPQKPVDPLSQTLSERGFTYGDFTDNARISQQLKNICEATPGWQRCNHTQREAVTMILQKIARICNGDPSHRDNWHDIQGYARLAEERLPR